MKKIKSTVHLEELNKIVHISDVHIRNFKRHEEYNRVFENLYRYIKTNFKEDFLIALTGDIVHSKTDVTPELVEMVQNFLRNLCSIGKVLMIPGNHDANLNNSHRMDALTPIVNAMNEPNLMYVKDTCQFTIKDKTFVHWSVLDSEDNYTKADKIKGAYKIALFHGPVNGVQIKENAQLLDQALNISDFDGFDIALLGDIHTRQFLNAEKTIGYPGSLIQQNHGETIGKGIYVWDLQSKKAEYIEIENDTAFYTVHVDTGIYDPLPSYLPKNIYLRVRYKNTTQSTIKDIISSIKETRNVIESSIQKVNDFSEVENQDRKLHNIDVRDVSYQNTILADFIKSNFENYEESTKRILDINTNLNKLLFKSDVPRNSMWIPKRFEFDNMFSYGKGNSIDFSNMEGTYGIFAPNASGKSTLLDSITYCIFDKCSKTTKAGQVMNNQATSFNCKLTFELHGKEYSIERKATKQKLGNVKVNVDFYCVEGDNKISLNGKDRSDTNAKIREVMGNYEDFVLTALSVQNNNTGFIDMSQSDRKDLLSQFLDINVYEELYQLANNESRDVSVLLKQQQKENYQDLLRKAEFDMDTYEIAIEEEKEKKHDCLKIIENCDLSILEKTKEFIKLKVEIQNIEQLKKTKNEYETAKTTIENMWEEQKSILQDLKFKIDSKTKNTALINIEEIKNRAEQWKINRELLTKKNLELTKAFANLSNNKKKMEKLAELKYDENCYFCMNNVFVKDAIETKKNISQEELILEALKQETEELQIKVKELSKFQEEEIAHNDSTAELAKLEIEYSKIELYVSKLLSKHKEASTIVNKTEELIVEYYFHLDSIEKNKNTTKQIEEVQKEKKTYESKLDSINKEITRLTIEYKLLEKNRDSYRKSIQVVKDLERQFKDYQQYLAATHRDGIPHQLIASIIPNVQEEINNILSQIVDFSIVLQAEDKSINAYIAYSEEDFWPLELTSGMEKFISSLAIRTSLINVSSLPKPNFLAIDEGFGALDSSNLNSMVMLFDYLKTQFKFIMIISHIDSMRDIVDNHLEINKIKGKSKIEHV